MSGTLTGNQIKALREQFGLTGQEFGSVLGVHHTTVYRWEQVGEDNASIEPLQVSVLSLMHEHGRKKTFREAVTKKVRLHGGLAALHAVLDAQYGG